jgi:hypothetical protein
MQLAMFLLGILTGLAAPGYVLLFSNAGKATSVKLIRALQAWWLLPPPESKPITPANAITPGAQRAYTFDPGTSVDRIIGIRCEVIAALRNMGASKEDAVSLTGKAISACSSTATSDEILFAAIKLQGQGARSA